MSYTMLVLDRIEDGGWAVLEPEGGGPELRLPRTWLPAAVSEGDVVSVEVKGDGKVRFTVDAEATRRRRAEVAARRDRLRRGPSGDVSL